MPSLDFFQTEFEKHLMQKSIIKEPKNLYEPIQYILNIGGKRLRPVFTLMVCTIFDKPYHKALDAAMAIELFHNFSLMHDDIMDNAPLRRGQQTVHEKWNINTGILSGDALLILAYQLFENYPPEVFYQLAKLFSTTAIEVCEGQQMDIDFQQKDEVSIDDYLLMITNKTAVLLGAAMAMGAIVAEVSEDEKNHIYEFGKNLGIAFQLQDDYLDTFGDSKTFGKQAGGDIIENKKTFLYLYALENASDEDVIILKNLFSIRPQNPTDKIETVKKIYQSSGSVTKIAEKIKNHTSDAISCLDLLSLNSENKKQLTDFANHLINRSI